MPKREDIKKILIIGSGPIVIGQAAEFDYSGTQACLALKEQGYTVILVNSNPATIMTDTNIADKVYMEPLTLSYLGRIIRKERPDALLPTLGGQTGLNLSMQLAKKGILKECRCEILGTGFDAIDRAEDREKFKALCVAIGEPVIASDVAETVEDGARIAAEIGYPVVLRPAFTLGGTGGGFASDESEFLPLMEHGLNLSPVGQVLVEKSIRGYKEIEFEVMRDKDDTALAVCSMENIDPVGVQTGDSIVVCPSQTLTSREYGMLRAAALRLIRALGIEGGCNVQFALDPFSMKYFVIEVNPRVSRSSALASKASGYPIAKVSALVAVGLSLTEIPVGAASACFEPAIDYVVTKIARFPFDKFDKASRSLSTQMKATGEVMAIGRTMEESLLKAVRSLESGVTHIWLKKFDNAPTDVLLQSIADATDERLYAIGELLRRGVDPMAIAGITQIDYFFITKIANIIAFESVLEKNPRDMAVLLAAKRLGISDGYIGKRWGMKEGEVYVLRREGDVLPVYRMIDSCAGEFEAHIPYYYSTYETENESIVSGRQSVIVLGAGPIRIGQGVEFDYSTVHAIRAIREAGFEAIIINNNPETVSTDHSISDKLYFEPLTVEDVMNVVSLEQPFGVIVTLGGQTAINLARRLSDLGVPIIGTGVNAIEAAENRDLFEKAMERLAIPRPEGRAVTTLEEGLQTARAIGYPVLVRPSYVLGGRAMRIVRDDEALLAYLGDAVRMDEGASKDHPVLVDRYIAGKELEVDAVADGTDVFIPGILQHVERTGVHSGDSISVYPTFSVSDAVKDTIRDYTERLGFGLDICGPFNIQFIVDPDEKVYVIEVNPRSSRTVPFISKATGIPLANMATKIALGQTLKDQGYGTYVAPEKTRYYVKAPVFSFGKIRGVEPTLSPEMKSTGEAIGYDRTLNRALYKALQASGMRVANYGTVLATIADEDKSRALPMIRRFYDLGFNIEATKGTADFLKANGIRTRTKRKMSQDPNDIMSSLRSGYVTYVINTLSETAGDNHRADGFLIRRLAVENNVALLTSLDTVEALLDVLEEITLTVSTIDQEDGRG